MKNKSNKFFLLAAVLLGIFWSYGISTRVGLLFVVPLWLKIVVMVGLGINFTLLAFLLVKRLFAWQTSKKTKLWLAVFAVILTILIFIFAPYHSVPFRTTHTLSISARDGDVKLVEVLSPDDNLVPRDAFETNDDVSMFDDNGFRLSDGGVLDYQRGQTGGLTLAFTADSGTASITWDGTTYIVDPQIILDQGKQKFDGWRMETDLKTGRLLVSLPGYTWGKPDLFWTVLGALLPVADFICLASLILIMLWISFGLLKKSLDFALSRQWLTAWLDTLICLGLAMLLINIGYPDFIPWWFLFFFLPATVMLAYHQFQYLSLQFDLNFACSLKATKTFTQIGVFLHHLNQSRWIFWILITLVALAGAFAQLHITEPGMGISGDSVHYMEGARNIAAGNGYVRQIAEGDPVVQTGFPPVYPIALLPGIWLGIGVETFARFLNTVLLILTVILSGWLLFKATGKVLPPFWTMLFFVLAPPILGIYSWVMSEPLFLVLLILCFLLLQWHLDKPTFWRAIIVGMVAGITTNTRLAGIVFIPVLALGILIFQKSRFITRLRDSVILAFVALAQPAAFFIRNSLTAGRVSESRGFTIAIFKQAYWDIIGQEVAGWFKWKSFFNFEYQQFNALFASLGVILLLMIGWIIFKKKLSKISAMDPTIILLIISIPAYIAVIVLNTILFTPDQTVSGLSRYMIPLLLILVIVLGKLFSDYWQKPYLFQKLVILFILIAGLQLYIPDEVAFIEKPSLNFRNYTDWKNECGTELDQIVNDLPQVSFLTNNCEYFYFMTGKTCRHLSLDEAAYQPGGEVYQAVQEGNIIAFTPGFGTEPPGIETFLSTLDDLGYSCYLEFYQLQNSDQ